MNRHEKNKNELQQTSLIELIMKFETSRVKRQIDAISYQTVKKYLERFQHICRIKVVKCVFLIFMPLFLVCLLNSPN